MKKLMTMMAVATVVVTVARAVPTVDVLVAYDQSAKTWLTANPEFGTLDDFAQKQVLKMNQVLENSGLSSFGAYKLAGTCEMEADLGGRKLGELLTSPSVYEAGSDWASVRTARENVKADIVLAFVCKDSSDGQTGNSIQMKPTDASGVRIPSCEGDCQVQYLAYHAAHAISICDIETCAGEDDYTAVHEIGHVMGAGHPYEIYNRDESGYFANACGYLYEDTTDGKWYTTIMGYNFDANGHSGITVLPIFSSPDRSNFTGHVLGDANHDNVAALKFTFPLVANFRISGDENGASTEGGDNGNSGNDNGNGGSENGGGTDVDDNGNGGNNGNGENSNNGERLEYFSYPKAVTRKGGIWDGANLIGVVQLKIGKTKEATHESKLSGSVVLMDGKKHAAKAMTKTVLRGSSVEQVMTVKDMPDMVVVLTQDGFSGSIGEFKIKGIDDYALEGIGRFSFVDGVPAVLGNGFELVTSAGDVSVLPDGEGIDLAGKWTLAKAGKVKIDKLTGMIITDGGNLSALKLSYAEKTGTFKGSFRFYTIEGGKLKKYPATVTGVVVGGMAAGQYMVKKTGDAGRIEIR